MKKGFTLIELMIVVAIIAIIAAIAIPSLLRARQAANESNSSAGCMTMTAHQAVFKRTDAEGNGCQDYWCEDILAFYGLVDGEGNLLKYIDIAVAKADFAPSTGAATALGYTTLTTGGTNAVPKAGYFYVQMVTDENGAAYAEDTTPSDGVANAYNNKADWAVCAFPSNYAKDGIRIFIVNCEGVVYGVDNKKAADPAKYGDPIDTWPDADPTSVTGASGKKWAVVQE